MAYEYFIKTPGFQSFDVLNFRTLFQKVSMNRFFYFFTYLYLTT